jgi:hypothetical protein
MRSLTLVAFLALAAAPSLFADVCVPDTLASYIALGAAGCMDGPFGVKDFNFTIISSTVKIGPRDITVTPVVAPDAFSLDFTSPTGKLSVGREGFIKLLIDYFWDPGDIRSAGEVMNDPATPPGFSQLTVNGCENSNFINGKCPTNPFTLILAATKPSQTELTASEVFAPNTVTSLGIQNAIDIQGNRCTPPKGSTVCADITKFENRITTTPEPSALLLGLVPAGAGILWGWRRRRLHPGQARH